MNDQEKFSPDEAVLPSIPDLSVDVDDKKLVEVLDVYIDLAKKKKEEINYDERKKQALFVW